MDVFPLGDGFMLIQTRFPRPSEDHGDYTWMQWTIACVLKESGALKAQHGWTPKQLVNCPTSGTHPELIGQEGAMLGA